MHRYLRWALRVLLQFVVAGGFTRAIDAWIVEMDASWQLTVLALVQLTVAFAQAYLEDHGALPRLLGPTSLSNYQREQLRCDRRVGKDG